MRTGRFYARGCSAKERLSLDEWSVGGATSGQTLDAAPEAVEIVIAVSSDPPGKKVKTVVVKDGTVISQSDQATPCRVVLKDTLPAGNRMSYYRASAKGGGLRLVSNPIFVRRPAVPPQR